MIYKPIHIIFASTEERDEFVETHFPTRKCDEVPGMYCIPGWGHVGVWMERVSLYPEPQKESA